MKPNIQSSQITKGLMIFNVLKISHSHTCTSKVHSLSSGVIHRGKYRVCTVLGPTTFVTGSAPLGVWNCLFNDMIPVRGYIRLINGTFCESRKMFVELRANECLRSRAPSEIKRKPYVDGYDSKER